MDVQPDDLRMFIDLQALFSTRPLDLNRLLTNSTITYKKLNSLILDVFFDCSAISARRNEAKRRYDIIPRRLKLSVKPVKVVVNPEAIDLQKTLPPLEIIAAVDDNDLLRVLLEQPHKLVRPENPSWFYSILEKQKPFSQLVAGFFVTAERQRILDKIDMLCQKFPDLLPVAQ